MRISNFLHQPVGMESIVGSMASSSFLVGRITVTVTGSLSPIVAREDFWF